MKRTLRNILILSLTTIISACGIFDREIDETAGIPADKLYDTAREHVRGRNWDSARKYLNAIENRHPYSSYAQQAMIDQAYVNWKDDQPERAIAVIDRFLQIYPSHPGTEYMLYLKGLITFTPPSHFLTSFAGQKPSERDPHGLRQSYTAFKVLIDNYPNSRYAADARQRLVWLVTTLAEHETNVARYYYEKKAYVAAVNRAQVVLTEFSGVPSAELALYILMKSYEALGSEDQAADAKSVLVKNFPNSRYLTHGFKGEGGFMKYLSPSKWFN